MLSSAIAPSLMCGNLLRLEQDLACFREESVEWLHIDVMDGVFVPNFQFGTETVRQLRKISDIPLDLHLMVTEPEKKLPWFDIQPGESVSVHIESTPHIQRCLAMIRSCGARAVLALNPGTPLTALEEVLSDCDGILVMTVNPGFAGQKLVPSTVNKVARLRAMLDEKGYSAVGIQVDGNVSFENARLLRAAGADCFVAGTSSVYRHDFAMRDAIRTLREAIH